MFALFFSPAVNNDVLLEQRDFAQDTILEVLESTRIKNLDDMGNSERLTLGVKLLVIFLNCFEDMLDSRDILKACVNVVMIDSISSYPTIVKPAL